MTTLYDEIGQNYDKTRRADPEITRRVYYHLQVFGECPVIDIACGTGNYTVALAQYGLQLTGVDVSEHMLNQAKKKANHINWVQADVEALPFPDNSYHGAACILSIHHFPNLYKSFAEVARVLRPGSRFVIFTSCPEQMENYWLNVYFPDMMAASIQQMPALDGVNEALETAGFDIVGHETFMIEPNLQDFFLYSGKYEPAMYLSEKVRSGISSFQHLDKADEIEQGLKQLREDVSNGTFQQRVRNYKSTRGDYVFVVGKKL